MSYIIKEKYDKKSETARPKPTLNEMNLKERQS